VGIAVSGQAGFNAGVAVEQPEVGVDVQQGEMFRLAVYIHQAFTEFLEQRQADGTTIHTRHAASLAADLARQGDVIRIIQQFLPLEDFVRSGAFGAGHLEGALHACQVCIGTNGGGIGATAEQHIHRVHNDGFARAGLAGQDDQPWSKVQVKLVNNGKVMDVQFGQHGLSIQLNARKAGVDDRCGDEKVDPLENQTKDIQIEQLDKNDRQGANHHGCSNGDKECA